MNGPLHKKEDGQSSREIKEPVNNNLDPDIIGITILWFIYK